MAAFGDFGAVAFAASADPTGFEAFGADDADLRASTPGASAVTADASA
jgi:hypothetical protein